MILAACERTQHSTSRLESAQIVRVKDEPDNCFFLFFEPPHFLPWLVRLGSYFHLARLISKTLITITKQILSIWRVQYRTNVFAHLREPFFGDTMSYEK